MKSYLINHDIIKTQIIESKLLSNFYKQEDLLNIYEKNMLKKYRELLLRCFHCPCWKKFINVN